MVQVRVPAEAWGDAPPDAEALVNQWLVSPGDRVAAGQPVVEIVMLKANIEIEAPADGVLTQILVAEGETFGRERDLAKIEAVGGEAALPTTAPAASPNGATSDPAAEAPAATPAAAPAAAISASPAARALAKQAGIDLRSVPGTGPGGRIGEADVRQYLERRPTSASTAGLTVKERIPFTGLRGMVAARLKAGWQTTPRVTETDDADLAACFALRDAHGAEWDRVAGVHVTINDLILRAVALTLRDHPRLNATVTDEAVLVHDEINLGVAVNLDDGLVVPVIQEVDRLSIPEIARQRAALVKAARSGALSPTAHQSGTFSVTNLGADGPAWFTPVINPPQCAILGVGSVRQCPIVRDGALAVGSLLALSLVFDHRAVDGLPAARFLRALIRRLEDPRDLVM